MKGLLRYKSIVFLLLWMYTGVQTFAQNKSGLTHIRDTSYTTYSTYNSTRKSHPEISIVPPFQLASVKEKRNIVYRQTGDRKLLMDVFYPAKNKKQKAAIMIIHGGGWRSGDRSQHYPLAQKLASMGYVCFTPAYRLSTEALFPAAVIDLKEALRKIHSLAGTYKIDTAKIAVLGFSAGGELAAFLGTTMYDPEFDSSMCNAPLSNHFNAVIDLDGTLSFVHPESGEGDDSKKTSAASYWFGYSKKENPALWQNASPLTHVNAFTPPFLFINSGVERMHAGRNDFIKQLDSLHIYSSVKTFADAPHSFPLFQPWFDPIVQYIDEFLQQLFFSKK